MTSFLRETSACFFLRKDVCELSAQWVLYLVAAGLKPSGDKGVTCTLRGSMWSVAEKRGVSAGKCLLGNRPVSVSVASLKAAHRKIQISAFQIMWLETKK